MIKMIMITGASELITNKMGTTGKPCNNFKIVEFSNLKAALNYAQNEFAEPNNSNIIISLYNTQKRVAAHFRYVNHVWYGCTAGHHITREEYGENCWEAWYWLNGDETHYLQSNRPYTVVNLRNLIGVKDDQGVMKGQIEYNNHKYSVNTAEIMDDHQHYKALGLDDDLKMYNVIWETTEEWNNTPVEDRDENLACDWLNPTSIEEI